MRKPILQTLALFAALGKPLSSDELLKNVHLANLKPAFLEHELDLLTREDLVVSDGSYITLRNTFSVLGAREELAHLYDRKLKSVEKAQHAFQYVPFVDFVLVTGSLAFGTPKPTSDIDVIIGAREGRIFIVRFFASLFLWLLGLRRRRSDTKRESSNKVCLNHFVTSRAYELRNPRDLYWATLYKNTFPIFGDKNSILQFFEANSWSLRRSNNWSYFLEKKNNPYRKTLEFFLRGGLGNLVERFSRYVQRWRFEQSIKMLKAETYPRIYFGDEELEFHPDTKRIRQYLEESERIISELTA